MYIPPDFEETDASEVLRLISAHPLAIIAYGANSLLSAQHLPLILDGERRLIGHVAASSDMCTSLPSEAEVLVIFSGQDSYISPNWYPTKQEHHRHVPTWNYQAVHIYGRLNFLKDSKAALAVVGKMTKHFETRTNGREGWKISDAPKEFITEMLARLTPFEIEIKEIRAKSKLSQNRERIDYSSVAEEMENANRPELAERMRSIETELYD